MHAVAGSDLGWHGEHFLLTTKSMSGKYIDKSPFLVLKRIFLFLPWHGINARLIKISAAWVIFSSRLPDIRRYLEYFLFPCGWLQPRKKKKWETACYIMSTRCVVRDLDTTFEPSDIFRLPE